MPDRKPGARAPTRKPSRPARAWSLAALLGCALAAAGPARAAGEHTNGAWSGTAATWPIIPIHAGLTPDGRVLTYGTGEVRADGTTDPTKQTGYFLYDVWDPAFGIGGGHTTLPNMTKTDLFCSAQIILPASLDMLLTGGDNWTGTQTTNLGNTDANLFSFANSQLTKTTGMNRTRWYATATTLPNGETYIQGGNYDGAANPEVRQLDGTFRLLGGADTSGIYWSYPRNWVAPDGRIFGYSDRAMYYVDWHGAGTITAAGSFAAGKPSGVTSSEVMYAPGKILRMGGGANGADDDVPSIKTAVTIDINGPTPVVTATAAMPKPLHYHNATVLPDGRVLVTGGSPRNNQLEGGPNFNALLWNPKNGKWTSGSWTGSGKARMYHSVALLLPGGMVLVGGGGAPGPQANDNVELYYPPYFYTTADQPAARPAITQAPGVVPYGQPFQVTTSGGIRRVTLLKAGAVTHSFNMDQRFMELGFTASGKTLTVTGPANANVAPPGMYMLFVLNAAGVPSAGQLVRIKIPGT